MTGDLGTEEGCGRAACAVTRPLQPVSKIAEPGWSGWVRLDQARINPLWVRGHFPVRVRPSPGRVGPGQPQAGLRESLHLHWVTGLPLSS